MFKKVRFFIGFLQNIIGVKILMILCFYTILTNSKYMVTKPDLP